MLLFCEMFAIFSFKTFLSLLCKQVFLLRMMRWALSLSGTCRVLVEYLSGTCRVAVSFTVSFTVSFVFWHPLGMNIICVIIYIMQKYLIYFVLIQIFYISPIFVALPCWNMRFIPWSCVPADRLWIFVSAMYLFNCSTACSFAVFASLSVAFDGRYFNSMI